MKQDLLEAKEFLKIFLMGTGGAVWGVIILAIIIHMLYSGGVAK